MVASIVQDLYNDYMSNPYDQIYGIPSAGGNAAGFADMTITHPGDYAPHTDTHPPARP